MFNLFNRLGRDCRGVAAVELALFAPILLTIAAGTIELGRGFHQATMAQRGLRAAAIFAARSEWPLSAADQTTVANLARTGTTSATAPVLASGWSEPSAQLTTVMDSYSVGADSIPVIRLTAQIPFDPLLPGLLDGVGLGSLMITVRHEQGYVGD